MEGGIKKLRNSSYVITYRAKKKKLKKKKKKKNKMNKENKNK